MQTRITSFQELITYFERPEVTVKEIDQICREAKIVWFVGTYSKPKTLQLLREFWAKYSSAECRPILLYDLDELREQV